MQSVAQAWLVYRLTNSSFMLGLVSFCTLIPVFLFSLFTGVLADRFDRHKLLLLAAALGAVQALCLGLLVMFGQVQPWHIVVLALFIGCVHAIETPARHSFIADIVSRKDLSNAIALSSSAFNIARFIGPPLAGMLIAMAGEGFVFLLNGVSYFAVLLAYLLMRLPAKGEGRPVGKALHEIGLALQFALHHVHVRTGLLLIGIGSMVGASLSVLMPIFTREVYNGGAQVLGYLMGAMGAGALLGAFSLARRTTAVSIDRVIGFAGLTTGVMLLLFSLNNSFMSAMLLLFVAGFSQTTLAASTNTMIQLSTPDHLRGRIMSLYSMTFIGLMPIGALLAGILAQWAGATYTVIGFATALVVSSMMFLLYVPLFNTSGEEV